MIPFRKSLAFRVLVVTIILLPLPLLVDAFVYLNSRYQQSLNQTKERLSLESKVIVYEVVRQVKAKDLALQLIEDELDLKNNFPTKKTEALDKKIQEIAERGKFKGLLLLKKDDDHYSIIASNTNDQEQNQLLLELTRIQLNKDLALLYNIKDRFYFIYLKQIYSKDHKIVGAILYANDITIPLNSDLKDRTYENGVVAHFAILNANMIVKYAYDHELEEEYFFPLTKKQIAKFENINRQLKHELHEKPLSLTFSKGTPFVEFEWKNQKWLGIIQPITGTSFFLLSYIREDQLALPYKTLLHFYYGLYFLILIIGSILATLATLRIAKPLKNLSITMEEIQKGNLEKRYTKDPLGFEINFLGSSFNNMIDSLLEKQKLVEAEKIKTERYNKELIIGQQIQRSLLPEKMPFFEGVSLDARYLPAKEVGGDFYDVFKRETFGQELVLVVADASGKGVGACFYSLGVRSYLRTFAYHYKDLQNICQKTNELFSPDCGETGMFVTAFVAIYDPTTKILSWASCGHPPMFIRRKNGELVTLSERSIALGVDETIKFVEKQTQLYEGDLVFLYTDGATDDQNERGQLYSEERLAHFVKEKGDLDVSKISDELLDDFKGFQGKALQYDDITLLLMKLL